MPAMFEREVAGQMMHFLADRALYWPARRRLLIADLHLGKGDAFRTAGIAVPRGGTADDLARLDALLQSTGARQLWVLGDFLHGPRSLAVEAAWRELQLRHPALSVSVVGGNHDRALQPAALRVTLLPEDVDDGPFRFRHHPRPATAPDGLHILCGHLHPVVLLPGLPGRFPAFALDPCQTVLPAFARFAGGTLIDDPAQRWIACAKGELLENRG
ncbi:ligase-associated DNA damage response endonuclease PdeM [Stenotrophomonas sp. YIM B06876]|uniref:ligase-associated DNA damage response endonuclease PdeM n=1 Tax=Stenotrophomonas sp. YIM B06876 TaxID=3060211 RepID=UPI0027381972|nr:ligase-associated DNA damage response endonuclease PdeM [Stenotrophomonas sp. YIM B06876]